MSLCDGYPLVRLALLIVWALGSYLSLIAEAPAPIAGVVRAVATRSTRARYVAIQTNRPPPYN